MKLFKKILIIIAVIIAIPLIIALFIKKEYKIEREVAINKTRQEVFNYIKNIKNQDYYSKWNMADPHKKTTSEGADGTVGFIYGWKGNDEVGEGEQEITALSQGDSITTQLRFKRPFESTTTTCMTTIPAPENSTVVRWQMRGRNNYPMNLMNLMLDGMLGKDMDTSLAYLKAELEKK